MNKIYIAIILCFISACTKASAEQKCHKWNKLPATCIDCTNGSGPTCWGWQSYPCTKSICEY